MVRFAEDRKRYLLDQLNHQFEKRLEKPLADQMAEFAAVYYAAASLEELEERGLDDLFGATLSSWHFLQTFSSHQLKIRVFNPVYEQHGWQSSHTIIEILHANMPFLVDSVHLALARQGVNIHAIQHIAIDSIRQDGQLTEWAALGNLTGDVGQETFMYIEVDCHNDDMQLTELKKRMLAILSDVRLSVEDFAAMKAKVHELFNQLVQQPPPLVPEDIDEAREFLQWMMGEHFTFLGVQEMAIEHDAGNSFLLPCGQALGLYRKEPAAEKIALSDLPASRQRLVLAPQILTFSKGERRSTVHRPAYPDVIVVKRFNEAGEVVGKVRFLGLFTSTVYHQSARLIPIVRKKHLPILNQHQPPPPTSRQENDAL